MSLRADNERLRRCITMAMGCISPLSRNVDERLAWYRLFDAIEGREPRNSNPVQDAEPAKQWHKAGRTVGANPATGASDAVGGSREP